MPLNMLLIAGGLFSFVAGLFTQGPIDAYWTCTGTGWVDQSYMNFKNVSGETLHVDGMFFGGDSVPEKFKADVGKIRKVEGGYVVLSGEISDMPPGHTWTLPFTMNGYTPLAERPTIGLTANGELIPMSVRDEGVGGPMALANAMNNIEQMHKDWANSKASAAAAQPKPNPPQAPVAAPPLPDTQPHPATPPQPEPTVAPKITAAAATTEKDEMALASEFVGQFVQAIVDQDLSARIKFYAPTVNFNGTAATPVEIRDAFNESYKAWPKRSYEYKKGTFRRDDEANAYVASIDIAVDQSSAEESRKFIDHKEIKFQPIGGTFQIFSESSRDKEQE